MNRVAVNFYQIVLKNAAAAVNWRLSPFGSKDTITPHTGGTGVCGRYCLALLKKETRKEVYA